MGLSSACVCLCVRVLLHTHLHQRHLRAEREEDLLGFGGIGIVAVFIEPLFERSSHVLKSLALMTNFPSALTRPERGKHSERSDTSMKSFYYTIWTSANV